MNILQKERTKPNFYEQIVKKTESREFSQKPVSANVKLKVLEAARETGSGMNSQHWRFILVQDRENLKRLADDSTTGLWVDKADFAVIALTNPRYKFHLVDAGRVVQSMMLAAWSFGVGSGIYTGFDMNAMSRDFVIPSDMNLAAAVGFGYPKKTITGKKNRKPLTELAYLEKFGQPLTS
jgi:nitroreductase